VENNETIFKNSSNFAEWCKKSLGIPCDMIFASDLLVLVVVV
jgi:hypothetical protein